jgi:hypothetical protein
MPYMTAINLEELIKAVVTKKQIKSGAVYQAEDPRLAITGGEVAASGTVATLTFGWNFSNTNNGNGVYTHKVNTLGFSDNGKSISVVSFTNCPSCRKLSSSRWQHEPNYRSSKRPGRPIAINVLFRSI